MEFYFYTRAIYGQNINIWKQHFYIQNNYVKFDILYFHDKVINPYLITHLVNKHNINSRKVEDLYQ